MDFPLFSGKESLEDAVLRFLLSQAQRLELQKLVARNFTDGRFMNKLRLGGVGSDLRYGTYLRRGRH